MAGLKAKNSSMGFSMVELIVVVAIIGILSTLVIPMYKRHAFKARQSEAKVNLSGLYTAEKSFYAEYGAYHTSFVALGFSPEGTVRYNVGFGSIPASYTKVADATTGYYDSLSVAQTAATNSRLYCANVAVAATPATLGMPGNTCTVVATSADAVLGLALPPMLGSEFTAYPGGFAAGATLNMDGEIYVQHFDTSSSYASTFGAPGLLFDLATRAHNAYAANVNLTSFLYSDFMAMNAAKQFESVRCVTASMTVPMFVPGLNIVMNVPVNIGGGIQMLDANGSVLSTGSGLTPTQMAALVRSTRLACTGDLTL